MVWGVYSGLGPSLSRYHCKVTPTRFISGIPFISKPPGPGVPNHQLEIIELCTNLSRKSGMFFSYVFFLSGLKCNHISIFLGFPERRGFPPVKPPFGVRSGEVAGDMIFIEFVQ